MDGPRAVEADFAVRAEVVMAVPQAEESLLVAHSSVSLRHATNSDSKGDEDHYTPFSYSA